MPTSVCIPFFYTLPESRKFTVNQQSMRGVILSLTLFLGATGLLAQVTYETSVQAPVRKVASVDLADLGPSYAYVEYLQMPKPGGEAYHRFLEEQKRKAELRFPLRDYVPVQPRSLVEPPEVLNTFSGNSWTAGIPLDNHLALNRDEQVVSVVNTHMLVAGPTGIWQESYNLDDFWAGLGEDEFYFDPRIIYDPEADRFVLVMMQDYDCAGSNITFAFSDTNDPTGTWHLYSFEGCPNADDTFADYPMFALTENELFFTYNAVYQDSSWQTGFAQTLIYQINKWDGYEGKDLNWRSWENIRHDGVKIRYMCPIKYATEDLSDQMYFLSTRSFDVTNDTIFFLHINGDLDNPDLALEVTPLISNQPYGVPPNAIQPQDRLQTNDARVLDGFLIEDEIQFVANTMDMETGRSAVYHGVVHFIDTEPLLTATVLRNESDHLAYPGITYTGLTPNDRDAIIVASHASEERFPGYSALYYNIDHSEWVTVKEGQRIIDMIKPNNGFGADPTLERWGDYSGIQRDHADIGSVWTASSYGKTGNKNDTWIGHLKRPEKSTSIVRPEVDAPEVSTYPNPVSTVVTVEINSITRGEVLEAFLYAPDGSLVATVYEGKVKADGPVRFHYNTSALPAGTYTLAISSGGSVLASQVVVVD